MTVLSHPLSCGLQVVRVLWSSVADELQESANKPIANALIETLHGQDVRPLLPIPTHPTGP
jgi:hypothetical protein